MEDGSGGGGGTYSLPSNIAYDDPLYTTYIKLTLNDYRGGDGGNGSSNNRNASSYPTFSAETPIWYGGGNGGGGGSAGSYSNSNSPIFLPGAGSAGSPGGILIEEAIYE